ncbi:hypothetical protein AAF712_016127 [Marasmius tenuissimus]|uniref:Uncharacterized protein n=1 Tax=Marasmius tenuissimus TaxID=585030 RepID=A0ABR2Z6H1_9AGAR
MTMVEYMCNYTAKLQLNTLIVFSALCASIKALQDNPPMDVDGNIDHTERSRQLMVKATNKLVGKRELTGQQTASALLGRKNQYVSDKFREYWWSSMLRDIAHDVFMDDSNTMVDEVDDEGIAGDSSGRAMVIPENKDDSLVILSAEVLNLRQGPEVDDINKKYSPLFYDMFYRPPELATSSVWDILRHFVKERKLKSKNNRKMYLSFKTGHPQYTTHCLKKLDSTIVPVLMGYRIPPWDCSNDDEKYAVTMLTLFKPWSDDKESPLKPKDLGWIDAFQQFKSLMSLEHVSITRNMQLLYQTKDTKFDFQARRTKRLTELKGIAREKGIDEESDNEYNPIWENVMRTVVLPRRLGQHAMREILSNKPGVLASIPFQQTQVHLQTDLRDVQRSVMITTESLQIWRGKGY